MEHAMIVKPIVLEKLRELARASRERAADLRIGYGKTPFAVLGRLADELEVEADALDHAREILAAFLVQ
jgi:hypothetical protein